MIAIMFKNLKKSEIITANVEKRVENLIDKFKDLKNSRIKVLVEMENSPIQSGPDYFKVKFMVYGGRYDGLVQEKSSLSFYLALSEIIENLNEQLNRYGDKIRVIKIQKERRMKRLMRTGN